jgi:arginyl-tRNA synthetase
MSFQELKETLVSRLSAAAETVFGHPAEGLDLDFPPKVELGHFAVGCFPLAKIFRKSPVEIAKRIAENMVADDLIETITAAGPYINIRVSAGKLFGDVCSEIFNADDRYGESTVGQGKRTMVEYLAPNTNKPLHLGHLRNGALGMSVARMLEATGHRVVKANLVNDRGVHICKSMLAWQRWGEGREPGAEGVKGDHFVGKWYVRYAREVENDATLESEVQQMLQRWEAGDPETVLLWKSMNGWVYEGFEETYRNFGLEFDTIYYESDTYSMGKDIIQKGLADNAFALDAKGNTIFHLPADEFGTEKDGESKKVTVLRPDGTSLYITQDIATTVLKVNDHDLESAIWVVGSEQEFHFKCLFQILAALGHGWAKDCYHLSYGMVYLPEGKMKSREGKIVDADDLIAEIKKLAAEEIRSRDYDGKLSPEEVAHRAETIGIGAIKFYLLRVRPTQSINFDPAESISFDGFTGPYCQYAYARIFGILAKAGAEVKAWQDSDFTLLGKPEEVLLLQKLIQFPVEVESAISEFNPSRIATHVFNIAKAFNQFYNRHPVLKAEDENLVRARLALISATAVVLKKALNLLGVNVLENM